MSGLELPIFPHHKPKFWQQRLLELGLQQTQYLRLAIKQPVISSCGELNFQVLFSLEALYKRFWKQVAKETVAFTGEHWCNFFPSVPLQKYPCFVPCILCGKLTLRGFSFIFFFLLFFFSERLHWLASLIIVVNIETHRKSTENPHIYD